MGTSQLLSIPDRGTFDARYLGFLETITHLRPKLHRYCARMTGSSACILSGLNSGLSARR